MDRTTGSEVAGVVVELLPKGLYRVELESRRRVVAHPAAGLGKNFVRLIEGDRVLVVLTPFDRGRGRIIRRIG